MQVNSPDILFNVYEFDEETKLKIRQAYNANADVIFKLNSLCLNAKLGINKPYLLHTNTYLLKQGSLSIVFQKSKSKIKIINFST
ncbi:hypothetical protein CAV_0562 [Campylobacter avium LMG 24591]|uniref:Uncharacterized protein n=1 Tax=Campylobacter avium LMG 24591 TaxID=522484 RepID=A0A222MWE3_9BACT|nr:hypothetical protein [Campylobacter avium]ASQ30229.1 hypothetical protein CAV_0562 [Campylobacter avium LMG 24591]OYD79327.1 hypothetical protein CAV8706_0564 [Campylobacter avium]